MSKYYSASRLKTFEDCVLKYKYKYVEKWKGVNLPKADVTEKGLALHSTFEQYHTGMTKEEAYSILEANIKEHPVDETKFNVRGGLERFFIFWDNFVKPLEENGFKIKKETWVKADIEEEPFIGAIDLFLDKGDECIIFDYKTASSISTSGYRSQLMLYAYMIGLNRGWDYKEIAEKVKLYVFFPLGKVTATSANTLEKEALNCIRQISYNAMDLYENTQHFIVDIVDIKNKKWKDVSTDCAKISFGCKWCEYAGSLEKGDFKGCPCSYNEGYRQLRKVYFEKEAES